MRMRGKPWARPELAACPFNIAVPSEHRGNWQNVFAEKKPLRMELGCGKGEFVAQICTREPEYNYLAIDIKSEVLVLAKRAVEAAYKEAYGPEKAVENVRVMSQDIERIATHTAECTVFAMVDAISDGKAQLSHIGNLHPPNQTTRPLRCPSCCQV